VQVNEKGSLQASENPLHINKRGKHKRSSFNPAILFLTSGAGRIFQGVFAGHISDSIWPKQQPQAQWSHLTEASINLLHSMLGQMTSPTKHHSHFVCCTSLRGNDDIELANDEHTFSSLPPVGPFFLTG